jgi:predicted phage terminase large subunit-like protein
MTRLSERDVLDALLRQDFASFVAKVFGTVSPGVDYLPNWHIRAIAHLLEGAARGEIRRLLITMPPRSLKSIAASVAFPAFLLGRDPTEKIVCVSYAEDLAEKFGRDTRAVMESDWYLRAFPRTRLSRHKSADLDFETTQRGGRLATSVGGTLTGRGGGAIIIDDPLKPADAMSEKRRATNLEWFRSTLLSRLDDQRNDVIIVVMQRVHEDDLAAHLINMGGWTRLNLPAIAMQDEFISIGQGQVYHRRQGEVLEQERVPLQELERLRAGLGPFYFAAQYQQEPVPEHGNLIRPDWFGSFSILSPPEQRGRLVQSWDLAVKEGELNDWSVGITAWVRGNVVFIVDVARQRLDYPKQRKLLIAKAQEFRPTAILIEAGATGDPLVADLRQLSVPGVPTPLTIRPRGSKADRAAIHSHRIEAGDVRIPERAEWREDFLNEMRAFPFGRHDDQVDALSQLLAWTESRRFSMPVPSGPIIVYG